MLNSENWAASIIGQTEHKLLELLEAKIKEDVSDWTHEDVDDVKDAAEALAHLECIQKAGAVK